MNRQNSVGTDESSSNALFHEKVKKILKLTTIPLWCIYILHTARGF